jgi:signal transduction histidine kinase
VKPPRSFRSRLLFGAILWTAGLLGFTHVLTTVLLHRYPKFTVVAHGTTLTIIAVALILAGLALVRLGMSPFNQLRERLSAVRHGRAKRLDGSYPTEVQPLVNDLNALLDHREQVVHRAQSKAGDLAHGLKTPLAVLAQEAERARASGQSELGAMIQQQVDRMRRQIDYHLAQARAAASGATPGAACSLQKSAEGLVRTLQHLHADRGLTIESAVDAKYFIRGQREDLDEMLGNLLDNACKWAKTRVSITAKQNGTMVFITVDDDGAGLAPSMREKVLQRGVRADEAAPGSGFGLAIVRDLAELYGGSITLADSPLGGLRARLLLPTSEPSSV